MGLAGKRGKSVRVRRHVCGFVGWVERELEGLWQEFVEGRAKVTLTLKPLRDKQGPTLNPKP